MIKCACGDKDCLTRLRIYGGQLWFTSKTGEMTLMYLSLNTTLELIRKLRETLGTLVNEAT